MGLMTARHNGEVVQFTYVLTVNGKAEYFIELKDCINKYIDETKFISTEGKLIHSDPMLIAEYLLENQRCDCVCFNDGEVTKRISITWVIAKANF
jgi:hypothetical protein